MNCWISEPKTLWDWLRYFTEVPELRNWLELQEHWVWQQYTGVNTKTGQEIYEGDIVKYYILSDEGKKGIVKFGEYANPWGGDEWTGHIGFYIEWNDDMTRKDLGYWTGSKVNSRNMIEVIDNIFESPSV